MSNGVLIEKLRDYNRTDVDDLMDKAADELEKMMNEYVPRSRIAAIEKEMEIIENKLTIVQKSAYNEIKRQEKEIKKLQEVIRQTRKSLWREQIENNPFDDNESSMPPEWNELTEKLIKECAN
jgi:TRAP-type C4-dicarboxylate transport system substrate-binding protein